MEKYYQLIAQMRERKSVKERQEEAQEAFQEAEGREMRRVINFRSEMLSAETKATERQERREKQVKEHRENRKACEVKKAVNMEKFLMRNLWCLILGAVVCLLDVFGVVNFWNCLAITLLLGTYLVMNFYAYVTRNQKPAKKEERLECAKAQCV